MVDAVSPSPEFLRHPAVAVSGQLILDGADELLQLAVRQRDRAFLGLVVVAATRQPDHLAPPSDGAGLRPVMIDEVSPSLTRRRRGVFCQVQFHRELADLALQRGDPGLVLRDDRGLGLLVGEFPPVVLGQPEL
jgi:hypothetical protein